MKSSVSLSNVPLSGIFAAKLYFNKIGAPHTQKKFYNLLAFLVTHVFLVSNISIYDSEHPWEVIMNMPESLNGTILYKSKKKKKKTKQENSPFLKVQWNIASPPFG